MKLTKSRDSRVRGSFDDGRARPLPTVTARDATHLHGAYTSSGTLATPFRASMALTVFPNSFTRTRLPTVPSTIASARPLRFLPLADDDGVDVGRPVGLPRGVS